MARILCIETSTEVCSVAIAENGVVTKCLEDVTGQNHSKLLTSYIDELLHSCGLNSADFDAVAVSEGPGSYTGLRIGVSAAKGFCYGASIPLMAINPLEAMASHVIANGEELGLTIDANDVLVPMIDARRMEVYMAQYDWHLNVLEGTEAKIIDCDSFSENADGQRLVYFGNGAAKCKQILSGAQFIFVDSIIASAKNMVALAERCFTEKRFVDVAYFEPFYLKEFVATTPKNSVLGSQAQP